MSSYMLRKINKELWTRARAKAGSASQLVAIIETLLKEWLKC